MGRSLSSHGWRAPAVALPLSGSSGALSRVSSGVLSRVFPGVPSGVFSRVLLGLLVLASGAGCGGGAAGDDELDDGPVCIADNECPAQQQCQGGVCQAPVSLTTRDAGEHACSVISCPDGSNSCCSAAAASATGNLRQEYGPRLQVLQNVTSIDGEVRADFMFDAPNQQGWVTFELDGEHDITQVGFLGRHEGVADRFLSVNTNRLDDGGCAFAFDPQFVPTPDPEPPFTVGSLVRLGSDEFCYGNGVPGRASELAFAIFSTSPGPAALVISNVTLHTD